MFVCCCCSTELTYIERFPGALAAYHFLKGCRMLACDYISKAAKWDLGHFLFPCTYLRLDCALLFLEAGPLLPPQLLQQLLPHLPIGAAVDVAAAAAPCCCWAVADTAPARVSPHLILGFGDSLAIINDIITDTITT